MTPFLDQAAIDAHDRAFAAAHPDWDAVHGSRRLVDPTVCLARRESPEDGAPLCGAWLSEHCVGCGLCPGVHSDDCPGGVLLDLSATYPTKEGSDA